MKKCGRGLLRALFDLRVIVGVSGVLLSIVMHELFHIILHWGEITNILLFPNHYTIVEILFVPSAHYDTAAEEGVAYIITMVTLLLTAMLVSDVHDARDQSTVASRILVNHDSPNTDENEALARLADILGIQSSRL